jgi:hypothetical protein
MTQVRVGWRAYVSPVGGSTGTDTDAQAFITAVAITDSVQVSALNTLVTDLKTYGLWTKMKALYPFVGGSAASHKFNLKDPRDLDVAYRLVFYGGMTHTNLGMVSNYTTSYADTRLTPSTALSSLFSQHVSVYSQTSAATPANNINSIGEWQDGTRSMVMKIRNLSNVFSWEVGNSSVGTTNMNGQGFYLGSVVANNSIKLYKNNVNVATNTNIFSGSLPSQLQPIGKNENKTFSFATIGEGLVDTEAANFYTAVQKFQTTLGRQVGTPYVSDADAVAFLTAAGITDGTQAAAINTLVTRMKADGVWTKMKAIYPFVGGTAASHKWNLKDPRDLDVAYRLAFNGGITHSSTGVLFGGSNGYANTFLTPSTSLVIGSSHMSFYSRTNTTVNGIDFGAEKTSNSFISFYGIIKNSSNNAYIRINRAGSPEATTPMSNSNVFFIANRASAFSGESLYVNSTKPTLTNAGNSNGIVNIPLFIGCLNDNGNPAYYTNRESAFASIGDGLTDTEALAFYNSVQAYQTTLGRQVNIPVVSDTDAQLFLNAANITSFQQASAVNKLVVDLKAAGVWTKMKAIYPFVGGSATSHKWNLKDPRDLDAAYRLVFNGGWTHTGTGALPNGSNGYADTKLKPTDMVQNSAHMSTYLRTQLDNGVDMGCSTNYYFFISANQGASQPPRGPLNLYSFSYTGLNLPTQAFYLASRTDSTTNKLYRNTSIISNQTNTSSVPEAYNIYLGAGNRNNSIWQPSAREQAFSSIGDGLTDAEVTALYTAVQTYQTSLGRQVDTPVYNNGLVLNLDASNANSYPGTGTTWFDLATSTNGSLVNSPTFNSNQFTFNGTNQFVNFGNINNIGTDSVTLVAWIKTTGNQDYAGIIGKAFYGDKLGRFSLHTRSGGKLGIITQNTSTGDLQITEVISTQNINTGNWVFVVAVIDRSYGNKLYINGVLDGVSTRDTSGVNWSTTENFTIGYYNGNTGGYFNGSISNAFMYRRVLTNNEIINLYNSTRGRFGL